jgi:hypothetical protein
VAVEAGNVQADLAMPDAPLISILDGLSRALVFTQERRKVGSHDVAFSIGAHLAKNFGSTDSKLILLEAHGPARSAPILPTK